ncbi:unnamed protein product [marine sediment metagenome]|uniref:Uncharacterized protein n=1 Tax=marine sediment metagenome TaxID=412755 RepID=X1MRV9_9ZZZZ
MGTRPLTDEERADIEKRLKDELERQQLLNNYIANLEQQLRDGATWCYEPEAFKQACEEIEEKAAARKKREEERKKQEEGREKQR